MRERLAILISGGGSTMHRMVSACKSEEIPIDIACVISSDPQSPGLEKARQSGVDSKDLLVIAPTDFRTQENKIDRNAFGDRIVRETQSRGVTVITQNGWLPLTPRGVIDTYPNSIFNQHPGPVPEFGGKGMFGRRVHAAVLLYTRLMRRDPYTIVTAQRVHYEFDKGAVIKSASVPILPTDAVEDLQQRAIPEEHRIQLELLRDIANGSVHELPERQSIVSAEDAEIVESIKKYACMLYPNG